MDGSCGHSLVRCFAPDDEAFVAAQFERSADRVAVAAGAGGDQHPTGRFGGPGASRAG